MPVLHVVVPCFNEAGTLDAVLGSLGRVRWPDGWRSEVTVVDDGSEPGAARAAEEACRAHAAALIRLPANRGKGAAIRAGFASILERAADPDAVAIHDADLEYDPQDLAALLAALPGHDAVFGNRWGGAADTRIKRRAHRLLNRILTGASNVLTGLSIHDMECCHKLFTVTSLRRILPELSEDRFGIEPQLAAVAARHRLRVTEGPVSYRPRGFAEGKKIRAKDGVRALLVIARERFRRGVA
jgi:glycosyltransferase involved in cell wall biosynthesis